MKTKTLLKKNEIKGIAAAPGIVIARAYLHSREELKVNDSSINNVEEAKGNLRQALEKSKHELGKILAIANEKMGEKRASIFEAQLMVLEDPILLDGIFNRIESEKKSPEYIVFDEITKYQNMMNSSDETYMKERANDIDDIKNRIIRNLQNKRLQSKIVNEVIVVTSNLSPADTLLFSRCNVKGFITDFGGLTSHAAIVSRSLNIPAIVGTHEATHVIKNDDLLIVDGFHGFIIINPDEEQLKIYSDKIEKICKYDSELADLKNKPAITLDGKEIILRGNIDLEEEIEILFQNGAKGIGLLRTEQIFSDYTDFPEEEEQYIIYKDFAEKIYPEKLVIRAFDVGGDKFLPHDIKEPNPFMGWRGIRFLLDNPDIFKAQIRAALRANTFRNIKFMIPMVTSLHEVRKTKVLIKECSKELKKEGLKFGEPLTLGIMLEIPSVAVMAEEFGEEVDFISIGTNDLIQFILAVDRGNDVVSSHYQEFHPAVIRTLAQVIKQGKKGALVSLCGEMAADTMAAPLLIGMGLEYMSVSPSVIPYLKKIIRNINYKDAKILADECLLLKTEQEITEKISEFYNKNLIKISKEIL